MKKGVRNGVLMKCVITCGLVFGLLGCGSGTESKVLTLWMRQRW